MKKERSDVKFILWRKKVDLSFLRHGMTPIPTWLVKQWEIESLFDFTDGPVEVAFKFDHKHLGKISRTIMPGRFQYRLYVGDVITAKLLSLYSHSFKNLVKSEPDYNLMEFIDIELDPQKKTYILRDYYRIEN